LQISDAAASHFLKFKGDFMTTINS